MTDCEQFIIGHFKSYGSTIRKSPGVDVKLSPKNWRKLVQLGGNLENELQKLGQDHLEMRTILWDDYLVAYTFLKPTRDEYGRSGVYNSTILVPIETFINACDMHVKIEPLFLRNLTEPPKNPLPLVSFEV